VHNITLRNVQQYGTLLPPGIIRCNSTNPCTGFVFDNVKAHGWWRLFGLNYIVENVEGTVIKSKPDPGFAGKDSQPTEMDFTNFISDNVYPFVASVLDSSKLSDRQVRINRSYHAAV